VSRELGVAESVTFVGPRPVSELGPLMERADVLVSPRIEGINTPMKIYSYMSSGRALLATDLPTHTQVLNDSRACLVSPDAESMAAGITRVSESAEYRERIAAAAKERAQENHTYNEFRDTVHNMYSQFEKEFNTPFEATEK
jgi:spore maturation protein CgeB